METMQKNRRPSEPILIVEDREENRELILAILKSLKIQAKTAENGKIGLEMAKKEKFSVYVVDLMMPVMNGKEFIAQLKEHDSDAVVLVQTALDTTDTIIEIMKMGVYDYIIKPLDTDHFGLVITKALEYKYLKNIESFLIQTENQKIRSQIEWLNYKETLRKDGKDSGEKTSIYNLKTSLSQGSGFGAMTTIVDMIRSSLKEMDDTNFSINKELMEILFENNDITKNMLKGLSNVSDLLDEPLEFSPYTGADIMREIPRFGEELIPFLPKKKLKINFPTLKNSCRVNVDMEKLQLVVEELLINAYKYAREGTSIDIFSNIKNGYLVISVKNEVRDDEYGGISDDKEKLVTLPFYRIHPPEESVTSIEKFALGLGLTMVENLMSKHNGLFFIFNVKDHTKPNVPTCVMAEIFLPINNL